MRAVLIFFVTLFAVAYAADECTHPKTNHKWSAGTAYNPIGECVTYTCMLGGGFGAKTCATAVAPGCERLPEDLTKPYPECCSKFKCPYVV